MIFQHGKIFAVFFSGGDEGLVSERGKNDTVVFSYNDFFYSIARIKKKGEHLYKKTPVLVVFASTKEQLWFF